MPRGDDTPQRPASPGDARAADTWPCGTLKRAPSTVEPLVSRRSLLVGVGGTVAALAGYRTIHAWSAPRAEVFIARNQRYDGPLETTLAEGLQSTGISPAWVCGKQVLLKPNLVEPTRKLPHMTTHPAMVAAACAVLRRWGARVVVGEGPGHVRDTEMALIESGMLDALEDGRVRFANLNYEETRWVKNRGRASPLKGFWLPRTVVESDLVISMPKMKTHHWVGFTASMKNLYGILPGIKYGWPKNVLHHAGIPQTVFDINASLPARLAAIVDGVVCMEGDGPILGTPKNMGLVLVGSNATAVDATVARLMGLDPSRVSYLKLAAGRLGPVDGRYIHQQGEEWRPLVRPFKVLDEPHLRELRAGVKIT